MSEIENRDLTEETLRSVGRLVIACENLRLALKFEESHPRNHDNEDLHTGQRMPTSFYIDHSSDPEEVIGELRALVVRANDIFSNNPQTVEQQHQDARKWYLGNIVRYAGSASILRGSLDRYKSEAIVPEVPPRTAIFFQTIPGLSDMLKRETHSHFGWHYHYCKQNRDRSDTILSFDAMSPQQKKPLFWEYHGEHKAKFKARPKSWSVEKRKSIYDVCEKDVLTRPASEFRRPGKDAVLTWPLKP